MTPHARPNLPIAGTARSRRQLRPAGSARNAFDLGDVAGACRRRWRRCRPTMTLRCMVLRGAGTEAFSAGADICRLRRRARHAGRRKIVTPQVLDAHAVDPAVPPSGGSDDHGLLPRRRRRHRHDVRLPRRRRKYPVRHHRPQSRALVPVRRDRSDHPDGRHRRRGGDPDRGPHLQRPRSLQEGPAVARGAGRGGGGARRWRWRRRIAEGSPLSARFHKAAMRKPARPAAGHGGGRAAASDFMETEDFKAAFRAFIAKRKPVWHGR